MKPALVILHPPRTKTCLYPGCGKTFVTRAPNRKWCAAHIRVAAREAKLRSMEKQRKLCQQIGA